MTRCLCQHDYVVKENLKVGLGVRKWVPGDVGLNDHKLFLTKLFYHGHLLCGDRVEDGLPGLGDEQCLR